MCTTYIGSLLHSRTSVCLGTSIHRTPNVSHDLRVVGDEVVGRCGLTNSRVHRRVAACFSWKRAVALEFRSRIFRNTLHITGRNSAENLHNFSVAIAACHEKRCATIIFSSLIDADTFRTQQPIHDFSVALFASNQKRCGTSICFCLMDDDTFHVRVICSFNF